MTDELGAIRVGLEVNLGRLDQDIANIKKKIGPLERDHKIPFSVGSVNFDAVQRQVNALAQKKIPIHLMPTVTAGAVAAMRKDIQAKLNAAGPIPVHIKANMSGADIKRIRDQITRGLGQVPINVKVTGVSGGGASGAPGATRTPATPAAARTATANPITPQPAASVATAVPAARPTRAPRATVAAPTPAAQAKAAKAERAQEEAILARQRADKAASDAAWEAERNRPAAAAPASPAAAPATKPRDTAYERQPGFVGPVQKTTGGRPRGLAKRLQKTAERTSVGAYERVPGFIGPIMAPRGARGRGGLGPNELKADTSRPQEPETEFEKDIAGRPNRPRIPMTEEEREWSERNLHGVRGAGRSGMGAHKEPVLTDLDRLATENAREAANFEAAERREEELLGPARKRAGRSASGRFVGKSARARISSWDPVLGPRLGEAYDALVAGDPKAARAALRGLTAELKTPDPRKRRKFYAIFRNAEKLPVAQSATIATLQAMFGELGIATSPAVVEDKLGTRKGPKDPTAPLAETGEMAAIVGQKVSGAEAVIKTSGRAKGTGSARPAGVVPVKASETRPKGTMPPARPEGLPDESRYTEKAMSAAAGRRAMAEADYRAWLRKQGGGRAFVLAEFEKWFSGRAGGGRVAGGTLAQRIAAAKAAKEGTYRVAEKRDELFVGDSGKMELLKQPEHLWSPPEDGTVKPFVPQWIQRMQKNAKDLTGREAGGRVRRREYQGPLEAEPFSGLGAPYKKTRAGFEGEREAIAAGGLSRTGGVQRVFVTNWPGVAGAAGGQVFGTGRAAAPGLTEKDLKGIGGYIGKSLRDAIGPTTEMKATPGAAKEGPSPKFSPTERFQALVAAREGGGGLNVQELLASARATTDALKEITQEIPVRSLAPAVGQITATAIGGRGEALSRLAKATDLSNKYKASIGDLVKQLAEQNKAQIALDKEPGNVKLQDALKEQESITQQVGERTLQLKDQMEDAAKSADSLGLKTRILGANTVGIIGGTLLFGAALGVAQTALELGSKAIDPFVQRLTGFFAVTAKVTGALADQTRAADGSVKTSVAAAEAQSGLSASVSASIAPLLEQRAAIEAGNKALLDQLDLIHTAGNLNLANIRSGAGRAPGPGQPAGGIPGVTASTGGLFGSPLFATPSLFEQIGNEIPGFDRTSTVLSQIARMAGILGGNPAAALGGAPPGAALLGDKTIQGFLKGRTIGEIGQPGFVQAAAAQGGPTRTEGGIPLITTQGSVGTLGGTKTNELTDQQLQTIQGLSDFSATLVTANENAAKAGETLGILNEEELKRKGATTTQIAALKTQSEAALKAAGVSDETRAGLALLGDVLVDTANIGKKVTAQEVARFGAAEAAGAATPTAENLIRQLTDRIIPAQKALFAAEGRLQRQTIAPANFALGQIAAPTPGTKGGPAFEAGLVGNDRGKVDKQAADIAAAYKKQVGGAIDFVNNRIDEGRRAMMELVPPELHAEFSTLLNDIESTGKLISGIQLDIQQRQVNYEVAQYNNELRIARRSLGDAKDLMAGIKGQTRETLGGLEGINIRLSRQLQLLQQELQQRQINFSVAIAGFQAPGLTSEERAARIQQAKLEASYAQKQLDLQKQIAANQFKGVTISASRSVTDLVAQIRLLEQGRELTLHTASAQRALDILNRKQQQLVEKAGSYIEQGVKIVNAATQAAYQVQVQTGKAFSYVLGETAKAWGIFGTQAALMLAALTGSSPTKRHGTENPNHGFASGVIGDTLGPTDITVGEAGRERVAILKNPRIISASQLAPSGGVPGGTGSGVNLTVIVTGNTIRDDSDIDTLVLKVARKVEDVLNARGSLIGMRNLTSG